MRVRRRGRRDGRPDRLWRSREGSVAAEGVVGEVAVDVVALVGMDGVDGDEGVVVVVVGEGSGGKAWGGICLDGVSCVITCYNPFASLELAVMLRHEAQRFGRDYCMAWTTCGTGFEP